MIISTVRTVENFDDAATWSSLRQFKNEAYAGKTITELHAPPEKHQQNIRKQARQIGYCIAQADEYFSAARHASLATKPLLTYYGTLSLALAEILLKQDGLSSLDAARSQNAHHGLLLRVAGNPSSMPNLSDAAAALRAVPFIDQADQAIGTFHLWHKGARDVPIVGVTKRIYDERKGQRTVGIIAEPGDHELEQLPTSGLTLLDCFRNLPALHRLLHGYSVVPELVRADAVLILDEPKKLQTVELMVHPADESAMKAVENRFEIGDDAKKVLKRTEFESGFALTLEASFDMEPGSIKLPSSFQQRAERFLFTPNGYLNELGYYYVALFILGTYCRYYPDLWMVEVSNYTATATLAAELLQSATIRVPTLALCELSREYLCVASDVY